jgi:hypothetical protein
VVNISYFGGVLVLRSDWTDPNDPYAIGYLAMKSHCEFKTNCERSMVSCVANTAANLQSIAPPRRRRRSQ